MAKNKLQLPRDRYMTFLTHHLKFSLELMVVDVDDCKRCGNTSDVVTADILTCEKWFLFVGKKICFIREQIVMRRDVIDIGTCKFFFPLVVASMSTCVLE